MSRKIEFTCDQCGKVSKTTVKERQRNVARGFKTVYLKEERLDFCPQCFNKLVKAVKGKLL